MNMIEKVKKTINRHHMLDEGDTVVVALSAGADSCALLSIMADLRNEYDLKIIIAHFNHGLRSGESDYEEIFCRNLAQKYQLPFESGKMASASVPGGESPEEYYRKERYRFLNQVAAFYKAKKIALGHHLSDQAETVLINILRGSGMEGLKGILPVRDQRFIRPLLDISKPEIMEYLKIKDLQYCSDSSNQSSAFLRNRIRLELIPLLKNRYNPQIEKELAQMAQIISRDHECLDHYTREILDWENIQNNKYSISFSAGFFARLPEALKYRFVKELLEGMTSDGKGIYYSHIHSVVDLARQNHTGKQVSLPFGLIAERQYDIILIKKGQTADKKDYQYSISIPGTVDLKERGIIISARQGRRDEVDFNKRGRFYFDLDEIRGGLTLRNRRPGDWFEPLGTVGRQKVKKLFIDHKVPRLNRSNIAILADEISVLWIENMHLSDRVKISQKTSRVLILEIKSLTDL